MLRTPSVVDSTGGAISENQARERGRMVKTADQVAQLAFENGLKVSPTIEASLLPTTRAQHGEDRNNKIYARDPEKPQNLENALAVLLPTPTLGHIRNHDEPVEDYLERREKAESGEYRGMPGVSLGVAVRMELFPTPNTMDMLPARTPEQKEANRGKGGYSNVRETVVNELLPTPAARDPKDGTTPHERDGVVQTDTITRAIFNSGEVELLPTTRVSMGNGPTQKEITEGNPKSRIETEVMLLPTPTAVDGNTVAKSELDADDPKHRLKVASQVLARDGISWGKFAPAIERWEKVLGRPAPAPTKPDGKDGSHRLSSKFTEWLMGLPDGWITDAGLSRNDELKACGNGVVPQQAELALRILLEGVALEKVI